MSQVTTDDGVTYQEYRAEIRSLAEIVVGAVEDGGRDLHGVVWEEIDSHQWIIYTHHNLDVLRHSDEGPEGWAEIADDVYGTWQDVVQLMAYRAMENDLYAELREHYSDTL